MSADKFQLKRGTTTQVNNYIPVVGEPVFNTTLKRLSVGDGITLGGIGVAPTESPPLTGTPTTPTATVDTNTTQVASTEFVLGQGGNSLPNVDGVASAGVSPRYTRMDHVHPTDTSRAPLVSPPFTGVPTAPTAAVGTNTDQIATTAMVQAEIANKRSWVNYTPTVTAESGTYTSVSATGRSMSAFGIRYYQVSITVTTKGTGAFPIFTLPVPGLSGLASFIVGSCEEVTTVQKGGTVRAISTTQARARGADGVDLIQADGNQINITGWYPEA